jgi:hypothetical protein
VFQWYTIVERLSGNLLAAKWRGLREELWKAEIATSEGGRCVRNSQIPKVLRLW